MVVQDVLGVHHELEQGMISSQIEDGDHGESVAVVAGGLSWLQWLH